MGVFSGLAHAGLFILKTEMSKHRETDCMVFLYTSYKLQARIAISQVYHKWGYNGMFTQLSIFEMRSSYVEKYADIIEKCQTSFSGCFVHR